MADRENSIMELTGKPGVGSYGAIIPGLFGRTTLRLQPTRIVEQTQKIIARRNCVVLLAQVDSVEIVEAGNPFWSALGFVTLVYLVRLLGVFAILISILFFVLYFIFKHKYLVVRSGSNIQLVMLNSQNGANAEQFVQAVLKAAEKLQPTK
jgi:hypothetical protein